MRYLRSFNQSISIDHISDIKDIILEIQDMGCTIDINTGVKYQVESRS